MASLDTKAMRRQWTVAVGPLAKSDSAATILSLCDALDAEREKFAALKAKSDRLADEASNCINGWDGGPSDKDRASFNAALEDWRKG